MLLNKGFKYRIYPTEGQIILIAKTFGCCRFVWNRMLADKKNYYQVNKKMLQTTPAQYKSEFEWLKEIDSLALANTQLNLQRAYKNYFKQSKVGFPQFKKKKNNQSYTTNNVHNSKDTIRLSDNKYLRLPKLGDVRIKLHRQLPANGVIKSVTISKTKSGKYYASILIEYDNQIPPQPVDLNNSLGIDFSMHSFYVDNQGNECGYPQFYRKAEKRLAREQRRLSRKQEGSHNYEKQRIKVAKLSEHVANQRTDWINKLARYIANNYDIVFFEDINLQAMSRCLHFGKSIYDQGFGQFRTTLDYMLKEIGKLGIYKINKWFPSSRTCRHCGIINKNLQLSDRVWICPDCGAVIERDLNAAINIRNQGIAELSQA